MLYKSKISDIKRAQKESVLLRLISQLFVHAAQENPALADLFINRVELSPSKGLCNVYFYTVHGKEYFKKVLEELKLYKPSMRKAIATEINSRYTCELTFKFDEQFDKVHRIETLLDTAKTELEENEE